MKLPKSGYLALSLLLFLFTPLTLLAYDWPQFDGNPQRSGNNTQETTLTSANVSGLVKLFQVNLGATADGAPAFLENVSTTGGTKNLVFLTTTDGHILARDALTGASVWSKQNPPGSCKINNGSNTCYTTSSPVVDPNRLYVYSYGLDGKVHKYQVGDGTEISTGGWPELITNKAFDEKGSSSLSLATAGGISYLYMVTSGYPGDNGDYQGHVVAINLSNGTQKVFNSLCSNQAVHFLETPGTPDCAEKQSGIWARAGVVYDAQTNRIYMVTGNAKFDPAHHHWGDTVFALNPDGSGNGAGNPVDTYTPTNYQALQGGDIDLGSTNVAILPVPAGSTIQNLGVVSGKDGKLRLLNLSNLSSQGGTGHTGGEVNSIIDTPQNLRSGAGYGGVLTQPAVWTNPSDNSTWVFVANFNGISGLKLGLNGSNVPVLNPVWQTANAGTSPVIANGVLYYMNNNIVRALNPLTGATLWSSNVIGGVHWQSPIVANGILYLSDNSSQLFAFGLNIPLPPSNLAATTFSSTQLNLTWTDNSSNETGFLVERKTGLDGTYSQIASLSANTVSYQDTGLLNGVTYYYRVRATNNQGNSAYSNQANATTTLPAPDTLVATASSFIQINLTWQDHSTGEAGFEIQRKTGSGGTFARIALTSPNATGFRDIGLTPNTTYYYQVRAFSAATTSSFSAPANDTTLAAADKVVNNNFDSGSGSLRQALTDVAINGSIGFANGVTSISPASALPALKSGVTLAGSCTTGPVVHLDGTNITASNTPGLSLGGNNIIFGIKIEKFTGVQLSDNLVSPAKPGNAFKCVGASSP
ncbi:MAG: fibronectin type III domain-containing protein [Chloroflexi bacterium]|nr:fibronectin type III domain-containing protein [Chloroflexota bacterium]